MKIQTLFAAFALVVLIVATTSCASSRKNGCPATWTSKPAFSKDKPIG